MNFISKPICFRNMFKLLIFCLLINASVCEFDGLNKFKRKKTSMGNYVHPSVFKTTARTAKESVGMEHVGTESSPESSQALNVLPSPLPVPLIVRRFVNILIRKAVLKDVGGDTIQLESIVDQNFNGTEQLSLTLNLRVKAAELKTLREFGLNKQNLTIYQIDELLNKLFSNPIPSEHCEEFSWDGLWSSLTFKMDELFILEVATFLCFVWILVRIIQGKSSWKLVLFAFISSAIVWEKARLLEEETIKSHSEQLRMANIPEHCLGNDNRGFWEKLFKKKPEDKECYEYHHHKLSKPTLRANYYKAFLNVFGPFLDTILSSVRVLFKSYDDESILSNWIFKGIMIPSFFLFLALIFTIILGGTVRLPFTSFGEVYNRPRVGSQVQSLPTVEKPKPPPRLKNGRKRREIDQADGGSTLVINVKGGSLNLNMTNNKPLPVVSRKELPISSSKTVCELQRSSSSTKDQVSESEETDSLSEKSDVEDEINTEGDNSKSVVEEYDSLAGGDSKSVAKEYFKDKEK